MPPQNFTPEFYRSLQRLHRRAWAHLEAVLLRDDRFGEYFLTMSTPAFGFLSTTHHMRPRTGSNKTAVEQPILQEAFEERRDATLRLLPKLVKGRSGAELHYVGTLVSGPEMGR